MSKVTYEPPRCRNCGSNLFRVAVNESLTYTWNADTGTYECDGEAEIKCLDCGTKLHDVFEDGVCDYVHPSNPEFRHRIVITRLEIKELLEDHLKREPTEAEITAFMTMLEPDKTAWFETNFTDFHAKALEEELGRKPTAKELEVSAKSLDDSMG